MLSGIRCCLFRWAFLVASGSSVLVGSRYFGSPPEH